MHYLGVLVVEFALALELIVDPVTLVGQFPRLIVELTFALHSVETPLALVHASVLVVEHSEPVTHVFPLVPLVLTPLFVSLHHVLPALRSTLPNLLGLLRPGNWKRLREDLLLGRGLPPILTLRLKAGHTICSCLYRKSFWLTGNDWLGGRKGVIKGLLMLIGLMLCHLPWSRARLEVRRIVLVAWRVQFGHPVVLLRHHDQILVYLGRSGVSTVREYITKRSSRIDIARMELGLSISNSTSSLPDFTPDCHEIVVLFIDHQHRDSLPEIGLLVAFNSIGRQQMRVGLPAAELRGSALTETCMSIDSFWLAIGVAVPGEIVLTNSKFLLLDHPFLEFQPVRTILLLPAEHELDQGCQLLRVVLLETVDVVLDGLPVNPGTLVPVAFVLILSQTCLQDHHTHGKDVTFVGMRMRLSRL